MTVALPDVLETALAALRAHLTETETVIRGLEALRDGAAEPSGVEITPDEVAAMLRPFERASRPSSTGEASGRGAAHRRKR